MTCKHSKKGTVNYDILSQMRLAAQRLKNKRKFYFSSLVWLRISLFAVPFIGCISFDLCTHITVLVYFSNTKKENRKKFKISSVILEKECKRASSNLGDVIVLFLVSYYLSHYYVDLYCVLSFIPFWKPHNHT